MPPHLHRRAPLRQSMPARRRALLLPPHHPQTHHRSTSPPLSPLCLRPAPAGGPFCHPILHRPSPPTHRLQRYRPAPRRTPPLRSPDRKPQPSPRSRPIPRSRGRNRGRDHPRPRSGHTRSTLRSRRGGHSPQPSRRALRSAQPTRNHRRRLTQQVRTTTPDSRSSDRESSRGSDPSYPPCRCRQVKPREASLPQARSDPHLPHLCQKEGSAGYTRESV
jgi:hypothetical protein